MVGDLLEPRRQAVGVLRAHGGQCPEHDEIEGALQELDAPRVFTGHTSEVDTGFTGMSSERGFGVRRFGVRQGSRSACLSANATIFEPGGDASRPSPPAAITTYCRPFRPRNVIGVACALASRVVSQSSPPVSASNARKRPSIVPPMNTRPEAVAIVPPMFGVPVLSKPRAFKSSNTPSGTRHRTAARLTSTARSSPNGGVEQGTRLSGFQNRPIGRPHGVVRR